MKNGKIYVAGIGPGCEDDITPAVKKAVSVSDVVVGFIRPRHPIPTPRSALQE